MKYYLKDVPAGTIVYDEDTVAVVLSAKRLLYIRYHGRDLVRSCSYFEDSHLHRSARCIFPADEK